jgi:hypothetical protein
MISAWPLSKRAHECKSAEFSGAGRARGLRETLYRSAHAKGVCNVEEASERRGFQLPEQIAINRESHHENWHYKLTDCTVQTAK